MTEQAAVMLAWPEVAKALMKDQRITRGLWKIGVRLQFAPANTGPTDALMMPSAVVAIHSVVLTPADKPGPLVFDAADLSGAKASSAAKVPAKNPPASKKVPRLAKKKAAKAR